MTEDDPEADYQKYLDEIHSNSTPDDVVRNAVAEITDVNIVSKDRIVAGEVNEVYDVLLLDGKHIIVRIHKTEHQGYFTQEKWAIEKCKQLGIPVPNILLIKQIEEENGYLSVCIQEKLKGDTLERGRSNIWKMDQGRLEVLMRETGNILGLIHSVKVEGFGDLDDEGKGEIPTLEYMLTEKPENVDKYFGLAQKWNIPQVEMSFALQTLERFSNRFGRVSPVLNHGDFGPKHIMYEGDEITGILDWGDVLGQSPVFDFARWEFWYGQSKILDWLKEGYTDQSVFSERNQDLIRLLQVNMGLESIGWYSRRNYTRGIEHVKERLSRYLNYFR